MSSAEKKPRLSVEEYFNYEAASDRKVEFYHGQVYDMAGGSEAHSLISMNFGAALVFALKGRPCRVYDSNFKVEVDEANYYAYPDLFVVCGPTLHSKLRQDICTNPTLIVEVLSDSTRHTDHGVKRFRYKMLESLKAYVTVEQGEPLVFVQSLNDQGEWVEHYFNGLDQSIPLPIEGISIQMADVYANVEFQS